MSFRTFLLFGLFISGFFVYGIAVGAYGIFPYAQIFWIKSALISRGDIVDELNTADGELLRFAFSGPIIDSEKVYQPVKALADILELNKSIFVPYENFFSAYEDIRLTGAEMLPFRNAGERILRLSYVFLGREYNAYAYVSEAEKRTQEVAVVIIPGSGDNQSSAIYLRDGDNYHHGVLDAFFDIDAFILIKPNHDILAIHDGQKKLDDSFIVNWHINNGGSYSASYIVQSMALTKYIQNKYTRTIVAGLSQGGAAALLNAMQSEPDMVIVSSGYSVIDDVAEWGGFNQIIIPGIRRILSWQNLSSRISNMKETNFFFSYGRDEVGTYKMESVSGTSCHKLNEINRDRVKCLSFDGGHAFPVSEIRSFIHSYFKVLQ